MESIRIVCGYLVDVFRRWWSRLWQSNIFNERESTPEQIPPQESSDDEAIEAVEERLAAIYITDVLCMYGTPWIKDMLSPYGRIKRIACFRFMPYVWKYLVVFASEDEAKAAFNEMKNPPDAAKDFKFNFVHHERLMNHYIILDSPDENVLITDY